MKPDHEETTVEMMLRGFHLPTMAALYEPTMRRAEVEGSSHRHVLEHFCQSEATDREQRRIGRLLTESGLPEGKTLGNFDEALLPVKIRRQLPALLEGGFVSRSTNILTFGLPGRGKTHFLASLGRKLILRHSMRVLFRPTFKLVRQLLAAKRELRLEADLKKTGTLPGRHPRRHRLRSAEPGGNGGALHLPCRRLRTPPRHDQFQSDLRAVGPDIQRQDGRHRPPRASRHHPRVPRQELPHEKEPGSRGSKPKK